jgi:acyl-coenzyme A synthetase/AMP-(fatty) acid ligase/acyl carrier protein
VAAFKAQMPWAELHNLYGPTEAAIDVSYWDCRNDCGTSVPIGKPIQNISLYILDEHQQLLPVGAAGELYIGGIGLAPGYLNRPELTAERFVANPYYVPGSFKSSERLYRTGDLARYRTDGNIEYLGRLDFQVKLRGFRIELGEIEAALGQLAGIDSALVVAHGTGERQQLVGYYKANSAGHAGQLALKAQLQQKLPEHMVPAVLIEVQDWPLNPNGKVDRKALPPVTVQASGGYQAPAGETEQLLAGIWSEVLGIPLAHISATASFFELGGHSLLLLRLLKAIEQQAGHRLTVKTVFKHHSVQLQGAYIDRLQASRALSEKLEKTNNLERIVF